MSLLTDESHLMAGTVDSDPHAVVLADGNVQSLAGLSRQETIALQWEQERAFARRIVAAKKGTPERADTIGRAYDTVTQIFAAAQGNLGGGPVMGVHSRHVRLVLDLLRRQRKRGLQPRIFEIGYGAGTLLKEVRDAGFPFAGIEVSRAMQKKAVGLIGHEHQEQLRVGDFLQEAHRPPTDRGASSIGTTFGNTFRPMRSARGCGGFTECSRRAANW